MESCNRDNKSLSDRDLEDCMSWVMNENSEKDLVYLIEQVIFRCEKGESVTIPVNDVTEAQFCINQVNKRARGRLVFLIKGKGKRVTGVICRIPGNGVTNIGGTPDWKEVLENADRIVKESYHKD